MKAYISLISLCFCVLISQAQKYDIPLNYEISQDVMLNNSSADSMFHSGIKPFNQWYLSNQSFNRSFRDTSDYYYDFTVLLFQKHLLEIHKKDVHIGMDILLNVNLGYRKYQKKNGYSHRASTNTRGFRVVANIGKNVSFETRFYENQFFFPNYLDSIVDSRDVAPGIGRVKTFKDAGWDVGNSMGTVSYQMSKLINVKFGHDKIFVGHGYRSLLLSDNASNYPLLAFNLKSRNNKWQYLAAYAWMQSLSRTLTTVSTEGLFKRKNASIHYLSFKPNNALEIGLFETTIYKRYDDSLGYINPHPSFYNPIIGVNTALNGFQGENNSLIGLSASYLHKSFQVFGQFAMDDLNKFGFQLGGKLFEPFGLKRNWVHLEFNTVPSYMYSHDFANIYQNYSHMNQELAHPLGASFSEVVAKYRFYYNRWFANLQFNFSYRVRGDKLQLGENILRPSNSSHIENLNYNDIQTYYWKLDGGYEFNIKTRFQIFGEISQRILINQQNKDATQKDFYFVFGIRCNLNNNYFDL